MPLRLRLIALALLLPSLLAAAPALADDEAPAEAAPEAEDTLPWPAESQLYELGVPDFGMFLTLPDGGVVSSAKEMEVDTGDDPMQYPFVWADDGTSPLNFDSIMLAVLDYGQEIDEQAFGEILNAENSNIQAQYTGGDSEASRFTTSDASEFAWTYAVFTNDAGEELSKFSTSDGNLYISLYFYGSHDLGTTDQNWAQMVNVVDSFRIGEAEEQ